MLYYDYSWLFAITLIYLVILKLSNLEYYRLNLYLVIVLFFNNTQLIFEYYKHFSMIKSSCFSHTQKSEK